MEWYRTEIGMVLLLLNYGLSIYPIGHKHGGNVTFNKINWFLNEQTKQKYTLVFHTTPCKQAWTNLCLK